MVKMAVDLGLVQETLLIPLLGRALETRIGNGVLSDPKAVEIVDQLDYDFSKFKGQRSLRGSSIRTRMFDGLVSSFLEQHPTGTVVEIGAGLNTRYERLDNGRAHWLEMDLPDSMALRRKFFDDTDRRTMVSADVTKTDWFAELRQHPAPYCFVSEAVLIFLPNAKVDKVLATLAQEFPGSMLVTDTTHTKMVDNQANHDSMNKLSQASWFQWRCDDPASLSYLGLHLERSMTLMDAPADVLAHMPFVMRFMATFLPRLVRWKLGRYKINHFTLMSPQ